MKPTSPLSLLLFVQLATSAPIRIPSIHSTSIPTQYRCAFASCQAYPSNDHTPTTKLSDPHFPAHQLSSSEDIPLDNRPYTPTSRILPAEALTAEHPLSSAYLKSLAGKTTDALPSKPTSALPDLREEDARRYWAEMVGAETPTSTSGPGSRKLQCGTHVLEAQATSTAYVVREYSDVMVMAIVLFFLVLVIGIEAVEKLGSDSGSMFARYRRRHDRIFLKDDGDGDETAAWAAGKSCCCSQPSPSAHYEINLSTEKGFDSESFDSDADEQV